MLKSAFTSPKIRELSRVLGIPFPHALGVCGLLWNFAAEHAPAGNVGKFADHAIAFACGWEGDAKQLIDALVECRLLDKCPSDRLLVHDWHDHCPRYVKGAMARKSPQPTGNPQPCAEKPSAFTEVRTEVRSQSATEVRPLSATTSPLPTPLPTPLPLPEDREPAAQVLAPTRAEPRVRSRKLAEAVGWSEPSGWTGITHAHRERWQALAPALDLDRELAAMHAWLCADPRRRKVRWESFVVNWLKRGQDRAHVSAAPTPNGHAKPDAKLARIHAMLGETP